MYFLSAKIEVFTWVMCTTLRLLGGYTEIWLWNILLIFCKYCCFTFLWRHSFECCARSGLIHCGIFRQIGCENNQWNKELNVKRSKFSTINFVDWRKKPVAAPDTCWKYSSYRYGGQKDWKEDKPPRKRKKETRSNTLGPVSWKGPSTILRRDRANGVLIN